MPARKGDTHRRPGRPQAAPPALLGDGEPFDGFALINEVRNRIGTVLCLTVRNLMLWAGTAPEDRPRLFSENAFRRMVLRLESADPPAFLQAHLLVLAQVLISGSEITEGELVQACQKVSRWAGEHRLRQTEISFAQAAALLVPERADLAYQVGLLCRRSEQYARAETWFRRTIVLARRRGDAHSYSMSWIGLGNLHMRRGQHKAAERAYLRALRKSRRAGLQVIKAMSLHSLFCVSVEVGRASEAESYAGQAASIYKPTDPKLVILAHDVAALWLSHGFHERALPVFSAVTPLLQNTRERLHALAATARASAGAKRKDIFTVAWIEAWGIIDQNPMMDSVATALVHLATGSAMLADWERAEMAGSFALRLLETRNEERTMAEAEAIWKVITERRFAQDAVLAPEVSPEQSERAELLAGRLVSKLEVCARRRVSTPRADLKEYG